MAEVPYETVHFSGRVQGVGFRYTVLQVAKEFEVCGTVQNLTDGRVRLEVEGPKTEINGLVEAIGERMHGYVRQVEREGGSRPARLRGFAIL